jgi:asparagine synthase (glutamine-hydrolysing)
VLRKGLIEPASRLPGFAHLPLGRKVRGLVRYANIPLPDRIYAFDYFTREPVEEVFEGERLRLVDRERVFDLVRSSYLEPDAGSDIQRMMHMDMSVTLADNDLRKVSRMTALAGVDVRYPMLDDDLIDFAATIPSNILLHEGRLRGFFKEGMTGILPEAVLTKSKHGFGLPFSRWLKTDAALKELVDSTLQDFKKRGIFRQSFIDRVIQSRQEPGETILDRFTWDIMMLELWLQHWQDGRTGEGLGQR